MRFHALFFLVKDRADLQVVFEALERPLNRPQLQVVFPEQFGIGPGLDGVRQVAPSSPMPLPIAVPCQPESGRCWH